MNADRPYSRAIDLLKRTGLRPTRQRISLARLLFDGPCRHVTAEQLHAEAQGAQAAISLATIYNALHQFTAAGLLREVVVDPGRSYFDTNVEDHHHFLIEGTGELRDIPAEALTVTALPPAPEGMSIARVDVVVRLSPDPAKRS